MAIHRYLRVVFFWQCHQHCRLVPQDLILAAGNGDHPEVLEFMLQQGVLRSRQSKDYHEDIYALHVVGSAKNVDVLVTHGMDVNAKDSNRKTPLITALDT